MFNNTAINVCLGIVFILLLYSLLASLLQEMVARWMGLRARMLQKSIRRMLEDGDSRFNSTLVNFFIDFGYEVAHFFVPLKKDSVTRVFYEQPQVKYLAESNWNSKPSYITAKNFSQTMIHLLRGDGYDGSQNQMQLIYTNLHNNSIKGTSIDPNTILYLKKLWVDSAQDIDRFALNLEAWYNETMVRVTGWYKRQTQLILFSIGMGIAISFNVDMIAITKILSTNDTIRDQLVNIAINRQKELGQTVEMLNSNKIDSAVTGISPDSTKVYVAVKDSVTEDAYKRLKEDAAGIQQLLGLGYGKKCSDDTNCLKKVDADRDTLKNQNKLDRAAIKALSVRYNECTACVENVSPYQEKNWRFWGWLLTAFGISLGAPFWFDLLNKIMLLRSAGAPPKKGADDPATINQPSIKPKG